MIGMAEATGPHLESFDQFIKESLDAGMASMPEQKFIVEANGSTTTVVLRAVNIEVGAPARVDEAGVDRLLLPRECRERGMSYGAPAAVTYEAEVDDRTVSMVKSAGQFPIMVKSSKCHLHGLGAEALIHYREEDTEMGGYFIVNGLEKVIRLLQVPQRNHAQAIQRSAYSKRGPLFTQNAVMMKCVRPDQSSTTNTLHFLINGAIRLRVSVAKNEFMIPLVVILKALRPEASDHEIYANLNVDPDVGACLDSLLQDQKCATATPVAFLGLMFADLLRNYFPKSEDPAVVGTFFLENYIAVHVRDLASKFDALVHMARKLYRFSLGKCREDNVDCVAHHNLLLPGHLLSAFVKEKIDEAMSGAAQHVQRLARAANTENATFDVAATVPKMVERYSRSIGAKIATFLATGNLVSSSGLDLQQVSGFVIIAERLNQWRYLSHFRSVHRGQFFTTMKTTAVRKLLPESWGFLCPVHTPDGSPCGLLSHLTAKVKIVCHQAQAPNLKPADLAAKLVEVLVSLGVSPCHAGYVALGQAKHAGAPRHGADAEALPVMLDGAVVGYASDAVCAAAVAVLRHLKTRLVFGFEIDATLEVAHVRPGSAHDPAAPAAGLFLFSQPSRFLRPVVQCARVPRLELIGSFEQTTLQVAVTAEATGASLGAPSTHAEVDAVGMLSILASLTPFSDYNQSPRNMYQCQMGKQTMGSPAHGLVHRCDNKMYRILFPQTPIVRTGAYDSFGFDEYPQGCNAVVAVISYTGYDMEDAMIIKKSSYERGFGHGVVYKTHIVDIDEEKTRRGKHADGRAIASLRFARTARGAGAAGASDEALKNIGDDGLPEVGSFISPGEPLWSAVDDAHGDLIVGLLKDTEPAYVQTVRLVGCGQQSLSRKAVITLRYPRNPVIGDKFSSRHGQKGVLSILWPECDMPFTESGISPDVIINPHAFPSRMTIGMLLESMAGKSGALHGAPKHDGTPFAFHEKDRAVDYFGEQLRAAGYEYFGAEPVYSGFSGALLQVDIFVGVVYYQRLRHMVSDKSQVRSTGPVHQLTRQPIKGRKRHGGIRLGEMERDALLAHGTAFLLHDRLFECSDKHTAGLCVSPNGEGSILVPMRTNHDEEKGEKVFSTLVMPYVYRYLVNELVGMNVKIQLRTKSV
mmetsp:Transcript_31207/g.105002  ORF Transcript_31207/g.105002 Transcript_31207/m.105002 type:complete len:1144 (-) Transcript_31207:61-3492(-)